MPAMLAVTIPYTAITIIFIVLATGVGVFIRRRSRDKCLRDFEGYYRQDNLGQSAR